MDAALEASDEGPRALKISLAVLAVTASLQLAVVLVSGSVALLSDTIHNFADALTALPLGLAFWLGRRPATRRYTYGFGRSEDLAGIFIVAMIALSSAVAAWQAINRLLHPQNVRNVGWVIAAGIIGAVGNELVAGLPHPRRAQDRVSGLGGRRAARPHRRTHVPGRRHRRHRRGRRIPDRRPLVGLLITAAILVVLKNAGRDIYRRLMDSVDPGLVDDVERVLSDVPGVEGVEAVRIRWVGHELRAEAEIISDADLSLADAHGVAEEAHHRLLHEIARLSEATIHSSPCGHDGRDHHAATAHHFDRRVVIRGDQESGAEASG